MISIFCSLLLDVKYDHAIHYITLQRITERSSEVLSSVMWWGAMPSSAEMKYGLLLVSAV